MADSAGRLAQGKVALVTGAGSGIGKAAALLFAAEGAAGVVVSDIDLPSAEGTRDEIIAAGGDAIAVRADVSSVQEVDAMVDAAVAHYGRLDAGINNAGMPGARGSVLDVTDEQWRQVIAVNLDSVFYSIRAEVRAFLLHDDGGAIVNISSGSTIDPIPTLFPYVATKMAVLGLTRTVAGQFPDRGIRVNAVLPGSTDTPMLARSRSEDTTGHVGSNKGGSRMGTADELAQAIVWLCSDRASFVHGQCISVDGGSHAYRGGYTIR